MERELRARSDLGGSAAFFSHRPRSGRSIGFHHATFRAWQRKSGILPLCHPERSAAQPKDLVFEATSRSRNACPAQRCPIPNPERPKPKPEKKHRLPLGFSAPLRFAQDDRRDGSSELDIRLTGLTVFSGQTLLPLHFNFCRTTLKKETSGITARGKVLCALRMITVASSETRIGSRPSTVRKTG